jgi:hypothetical protein
MLNYLQTMSLVNFFNMSWPGLLFGIMNVYGRISSFLQFTVSTECLYKTETRPIFINLMFVLVAPFFVIAGISLLWGLVALCKRNMNYLRIHLPTTLVFILFIAYTYIINPLLLFISCHHMEEDSWWLVDDYGVECWTGDHLDFIYSTFVPALLIWGIGLPVFFVTLIYKMSGRLHELDIAVIMNYFMRGYKEKYFYWELVIMARKLALILIGAQMATNTGLLRGASGFSVMGFALFLQYRYAPLQTDALNFTEYIAMIANTATLYCGMFFATDARNNATFNVGLLIIVLGVNFYFVFYWMRNVYNHWLLAKILKRWPGWIKYHNALARLAIGKKKTADGTRHKYNMVFPKKIDDSLSIDDEKHFSESGSPASGSMSDSIYMDNHPMVSIQEERDESRSIVSSSKSGEHSTGEKPSETPDSSSKSDPSSLSGNSLSNSSSD